MCWVGENGCPFHLHRNRNHVTAIGAQRYMERHLGQTRGWHSLTRNWKREPQRMSIICSATNTPLVIY